MKRATSEDRRGVFTSGIVATAVGQKMALYFSGDKHAGENLADVMKWRAAELPPPIQMCDALSRNLPGELQTIVAHCLAHARRQFVDIYDRFPEPCRYLLEALAMVYRNDASARERRLSPEAPCGLPFRTRHSPRAMRVPPVARAPSTRRPRA